uniref:Uncharacterized protein n=1 Tax=Iridovirus LCIVAC01 TaxID=2506607 RepID=A0A481YS65_9VIRU|nr:MAG: hypothetical protein LCIVAC01_01130 [Iridovirus LCIVAC01]
MTNQKLETEIKELENLLSNPELTKKEIRSIKYRIWYRKNKAKVNNFNIKKYQENIEENRAVRRAYYYEVTKPKNDKKVKKKSGRPPKYVTNTEVSVN